MACKVFDSFSIRDLVNAKVFNSRILECGTASLTGHIIATAQKHYIVPFRTVQYATLLIPLQKKGHLEEPE